MRLVTFDDAGVGRVGVVDGDALHPFAAGLTMRDLVAAGLDAAHGLADDARSTPARPLEGVRLRAPLQPASLRDFVAFEEHVEGVRRSIDGVSGVADAWYDAPTFYFTNPHTVLGPHDDVAFPARSVDRDFELEVAVVVGLGGASIPVEDGTRHIFGYTILNDWSARDLQRREMQVSLGPAKGKDFANTLGPCIVTADELEPHRDSEGFLELWCVAEVNGEPVGRDLLSNMGWTFEALIAHASRDSLVLPGDVLGSGTTGNGGCLAELWGRHGRQDPPPLRTGDTVTVIVEGIGTMTTTITDAPQSPPGPAPRRRSPAQARERYSLRP